MFRSLLISRIVTVAIALPAAYATRFTYNDPAVTLNGAWTPQTDTRAAAGGVSVSNTPGNTVTITFTGDSITLYRRLDVDGGMVSATVDNNPAGTIDFYFPQQTWQIPAVLDHLGAGQHQLVLSISPQANTASTGMNVYIDTFEVPATFAPNDAQKAALARTNQYRAQMGLPAAQLSTALDLSAQAHADYNASSGILGHNESQGTAGFLGTNFWDRNAYFGYDSGTSENAAPWGDPNSAVEGWMNTMYHRVPFAGYRNIEVGYGLSLLNNQKMDVMDFGNKHSTAPAARVLTTYPANNLTEVPLLWSEEIPDPLPNVPRPLGFPISLHIAQPSNPVNGTDTVANSGILTDSNNNPVPVIFIDRKSDPNGFLKDDYFIVPKQPLAASTTYQAQITGIDVSGNQFTSTWKFTTVPAAAVSGFSPFLATPTSIWIQWMTAGPVQMTSLQYGTTTAYGTTLAGVNNNTANSNSYAAQPSNLTPGTTYHYQVTATDATGTTRSSTDLTFTTPVQ